MFQALYDSGWHHPGVAWLAGVAVFIAIATRRPALAGLLALLELEIVVDALFTGTFSPLPPSSSASTVVAIVFVVLGDLRYFYLVERQRLDRGKALAAALGWALIIPVLSVVPQRVWPEVFSNTRNVFLLYELAFAALALGMMSHVRRRFEPGPIRVWLERLTTFELVQYALWALADIVILAGADAGFALRLVPNVLYYAAFVPFVMATAPREARP